MLTYIAVYLLSYLLPILLVGFSTRKADADKRVSMFKIGRESTSVCAEIFIILTVISTALGYLFPADIVQYELSPANFAIAGITAPILEEIFWRGTVFKKLSLYGTSQAMIISSLLFGMFHNGTAGLIYAFIAGMLYSYLYVRTGSVLPCVLLHIINNTLSLISINYKWIILAAAACAVLIIITTHITRHRSNSDNNEAAYVPMSYTVIASPILYFSIIVLILIRTTVS
ncbi:MAG: CPBP family intramembrane metalloprotease [Clostridia bacterium]|nr:CPBP family intramembrane metalloprotease [Clostridia bacterium]